MELLTETTQRIINQAYKTELESMRYFITTRWMSASVAAQDSEMTSFLEKILIIISERNQKEASK